jgi:O-antigen ligase
MTNAAAMTNAATRLGPFGLYLFALAAVWKTAPGHIGIALALLAVLLPLCTAPRRAWDTVAKLSATLAGWLLVRGVLQWQGLGEPGLSDSAGVFEDWMFLLLFAPLAALPVTDRVKRAGLLWGLAMLGFTLGIADFLHLRGVQVLWSGERLGFHLAKPLGIGLYAGCFLIVVAATWRWWWNARAWRWPVRVLGLATLGLNLEVLITVQNRSTYLGLALVSSVAVGWRLWSAARTPVAGQWRSVALVGFCAILMGAALIGVNRDVVQQRLGAEQDVVQSIEAEGLERAPASSISIRLHLWRYALERFADAPLIGHGFGNLTHVVDRDLRQRVALTPDEIYDHVHNTYLQTLWTQGLLGTGLWALLILALLRDVIRAARRDARVRESMPAIWGVLGFIAVWAFFDYRLSHPDMRFFTVLLLLSLRLLGQSEGPHAQAGRSADAEDAR